MLAPFVFPEGLVVAVDVHPVFVHVREEIGAVLCFQDVRDVGIGAAGVAV